MTPKGSFHGSKRETWQIKGPRGSTPYLTIVAAAFSLDIGRFLGVNGSMAGGIMATGGSHGSGLTNSGMLNTAVSSPMSRGLNAFHDSASGADVSMWHRYTHRASDALANSRIAADWGSCRNTTS